MNATTQENPLLTREFWKTATTEEDLQRQIDAGAIIDAHACVQRAVDRDGWQPLDACGWTPLHFAAEVSKAPAVVKLLLQLMQEKSLNIDAPDTNEWTPLHVAVDANGTSAVVEQLLDGGANPIAETADGETPLNLIERQISSAGSHILQDTEAHRRLRKAQYQ